MTQVTISIAASGDDNSRNRSGTAYPPVNDGGDGPTYGYVAPSKRFETPNYNNAVSFMRFDTGSVIPDDATVTAATLRLYNEWAGDGVDARNVNFEWYQGGSWASAGTLADSDYVDLVGTTAATVLQSTIANGVTIDFVLSSPAANINKTGYTGIRTGISGGTPTGLNTVYFGSWDHATYPEPKLIVEYDLAPTFRFDTSKFPKAMMRSAVPVRW